MGQTFQDVCPLLLQRSGTTKYLHPVRITNDLQLSAYNLPPAVSVTIAYEAVTEGDSHSKALPDENQYI